MAITSSSKVLDDIAAKIHLLTPKERKLGSFIIENLSKVVFMTTKELSAACKVSEATVVRFSSHLGYDRFGKFRQTLRDILDTELTLQERINLPAPSEPGDELLHHVLTVEMNNIRRINETVDTSVLSVFTEHLSSAPAVYVIGSRLSFTFAYYLGWSLFKVRRAVHTLKGSDSTSIDELTHADTNSLVIIIASSRYPNELIRLGKLTRRLGLTLLVIADSVFCPLIQFAHSSLVIPSRSIPFIGHPTAISCIINYLVLAVARKNTANFKKHQNHLEKIYIENDVLFNIDKNT